MPVGQTLRGVMIPLTTPFDQSGDIDELAFIAQLHWMVEQGVHGVVVGGSTGEGYSLSGAELVRLVELATAEIGGQVPVLASVIADSTREAEHRASLLSRCRISALQVAPPHYIFTPSPEEITSFYSSVSEASGAPIVIYNVVPWANIKPALAESIISANPRVIAIKQSDRDLGAYAELVNRLGSERVFAAIDGALMSCYDLGAAGSIAAIASAAPRASVALWDAVIGQRRAEAFALHTGLLDVWSTLSGSSLPARVKAAQSVQGIPAGSPRAPMGPVNATEYASIAIALDKINRVVKSHV